MVCLSQELRKEKFIKEHSVVNPKTTVREGKPIDAAQLLIELVIVCSIPYLEELSDMIAFSSLSTLLLI